MTDNEIIKALENCADGSGTGLIRATIDLISRQKAEIERLQNDYLSMQSTLAKMSTGVEQAKAEAIKEFAKRLQAKAQFSKDFGDAAVSYDDIDNLVKEMTE